MGSGKGAPDHWVAVVKPGRIIFELGGVREEVAKEAMRLAANKLPIKTKFLVRQARAAGGPECRSLGISVARSTAWISWGQSRHWLRDGVLLFELRLQKERGEVKNNRQFPQLKKEIARLLQHIGELNNVALVESPTRRRWTIVPADRKMRKNMTTA